MTSGPLIVQSDKTALLEVDHELAGEARHELAVFAELERAPEHIHTYRITKLGLWNARAAGHDSDFVLGVLDRFVRWWHGAAHPRHVVDPGSVHGSGMGESVHSKEMQR